MNPVTEIDESFHDNCYCLYTNYNKIEFINTVKECIDELWNRNMMKIFITNAIMSSVHVPVGMHVFHINSIVFTQFTFKLSSTNTIKEGIHKLWNRNMMKIFITNVIVFTQFTFKLNSINIVKEGINELWKRNRMKIFITNVIVFTQFTFKMNSINTLKECIHEPGNRNMMNIL